MRVDLDSRELVFDGSGRRVGMSNAIVGIDLHNLDLYQGYDCPIPANPRSEYNELGDAPLTLDERRELAVYMIAKWRTFAALGLAGGNAPHDSDCAVHNEPAYPAGPCDCNAGENVNERRPETFEELRERIQYIMRLSRARGREPGDVDWEALYQEYVARYGAEANTEKP